MLFDINGNKLKNISETEELKFAAIKMLKEMIDQPKDLLQDWFDELKKNDDFEFFCDAISIPMAEFFERCQQMHQVIESGVLITEDVLGLPMERDYTDMQKDLIAEMMYYIDCKRNK